MMLAKFLRSLRKQIKSQTLSSSEFVAAIGNHDGVIYSEKDGYVYVTHALTGQVYEVLNRKVPAVAPLKRVIVGYENPKAPVLEILRELNPYGTLDTIPNVPEHAKTHQYPGHDTLYVRPEQNLAFLVVPSQTYPYKALLYGGAAYINNTWVRIQNQTVDLESYIPSAGARYVLIYADGTGTVAVKSGTVVDDKNVLGVSDIPSIPQNCVGIAAVKLYDGMERIRKESIKNPTTDFVEIRTVLPANQANGNNIFQRNLSSDLILTNGECLVATGYLDPGSNAIDCQGDAEVLII